VKLACQEQLIPGESLEEKWRVVSAAGFDGIELLGRGDGEFGRRLPELRAARDAGVVISSVCVAMDHFIGDFDPERRRDAIEQMKTLLSVIAEVGGVGAITPAAFGQWSNALPPWEPPPRSPEEDRKVLAEALTELAEHAAGDGVTVFFEPLNRYEDHMVNTLAQAADVVGVVGRPSVQVMADTFHMSVEEDDLGASIREAAGSIGHVQLGDSGRLQPGVGHLDWPPVMQALRDVGFDGWLAMECGIRGDPRDALPKVAELLRPLMEPEGHRRRPD
jgi:sugar phosphate isomerase/epimerase